MANKLLRLVQLVVTTVVFIGGTAYAYLHRDELAVILKVSAIEACALLAAMTVAFLVVAYTFRLMASMLKAELRPSEWIGLTFLANAFNYMGPTGPGAIAKATYLKRKVAMPYSRFSSLLAANAFFFLFISSAIGLVLLGVQRKVDSGTLFLGTVCIVLLGVSSAPLLLPLYHFRRKGRLFNLLNNAVYGLEEIRGQRLKSLGVGGAIVAQHAVSALCCQISFRALGLEIDWIVALTLVVFASIANAISITPSNIGIQELVMAYVYKVAGMSFTDGLVAATLIRAAHVSVTFTGAPLFAWLLLGSVKLRLPSTSNNSQAVESAAMSGGPDRSRSPTAAVERPE